MTNKKKPHTEKEPIVLTEWQKRNLEFLEKKKLQAEEEQKLSEKLINEKKAQLLPKGSEETDAEVIEDDQKEKKAVQETEKVAKEPKIKKEKTKRQKAFLKALPVLLISFVIFLGSIFFLTPYSKMKDFAVEGNHHTTLVELTDQSQIKRSDYFLKVLFSARKYENAIKKTNPWIKDISINYSFPDHFTFKIKEYNIIAYAQVQEGFQPILENGVRVNLVKQSQLPKDYLIINLENEKDIQTLIKSLISLPQKLTADIKAISPAHSKSTVDLLLIEMHDGNTIRVPLSQLEKKLPYYLKIKKDLQSPSIVDMEVGLYSTTSDIETKPNQVSQEESQSNTSSETSNQTEATNPSASTDASHPSQAETPGATALQTSPETGPVHAEQSVQSVD